MIDTSKATFAELKEFYSSSFTRHVTALATWAVERLHRGVQARGHQGLRRAHDHIFVNLDIEGTRLVEVARQAGVTKNAIVQLANEMEALGYISRESDARDGRAKLLRYTDQGLGMLTAAMASNAELLSEIEQIIGKDDLREFRRILARVVAGLSLGAGVAQGSSALDAD